MSETPPLLQWLLAVQVLLATCFDDAQLETLKGLEGLYVRLDMDPLSNVSATAMEASQGKAFCIYAAGLVVLKAFVEC